MYIYIKKKKLDSQTASTSAHRIPYTLIADKGKKIFSNRACSRALTIHKVVIVYIRVALCL
jgi:hypothetical protein